MPDLAKMRCGTCRFYEPGDEPGRGFCVNPALAPVQGRTTVREDVLNCAGQYHGRPHYWEARQQKGWWPFGRR